MGNVRVLLFVFLCTGMVLFTSSCSFIQRVTEPAAHEKKVIDDTAKRAQAHIALGEHAKALDLYSSAYDKYHYQGMRSGYARIGEHIRNAADAVFQKRDFAEAGNIYTLLFESGITTRDFAGSLSFDDDYLSNQIAHSSKALLEAGLTKYREGKLEDAIAVWKKALAFDQDNKDIKSAIDTATTQLQNLKNIK
jgi:tetratricopeptide (TPR) repeat protein